MGNDESHFRREEDQKRLESIQSRIVSLTDSEVMQNDRLDETDDEIRTLKEMLEGKSGDKDDNGIKGDLHDLSVGLNELRRLMMPDHLGQGGVIARLRTLERRAGIEEHDLDNRWKFKTAVAIAIISAIVAILTNLDRIEPPFKKMFGSVEESRPQKKRSGKTSKRRQRPAVKETPTEATDDGANKEDMSDGRSGNGGHPE